MDWQKVIVDLEAAGLTQYEIAEKCGASQPYVSQLKTGKRKQVNFILGEALRSLHAKTRKGRPQHA